MLLFSKFFSPLFVTLSCFMLSSFQFGLIFKKTCLCENHHYFHAHLAQTNSLIKQMFKQKRTIIYGLLYQLQCRNPVKNTPGSVQVPKTTKPSKRRTRAMSILLFSSSSPNYIFTSEEYDSRL